MDQRSRSESASTAATHGDVAALFAAERVAMVRMATLIVGSVAQAEEIVQDSFIVVEQRWGDLDNPGGYLRSAVVNGCRQALRRREVEARHLGAQRVLPPDAPTRLVELNDALRCLDERQRTVIVLRYFVDVPDIEIASVLDCRPSTVRSIAHRALKMLRKELS